MPEAFSDYGISIPGGRAAGELDTQCPQCSPSRKKKNEKCLSVNIDTGTWLCHHCGWSGGLHYRDQWQRERPAPKVYTRPSWTPPVVVPTEFFSYFSERGISPVTLAAAKVSYENGWIKFPYYRGDELVNIKSRKLKEKAFHQETGAEKILYGMDVRPPHGETHHRLVWVEGEIDRLSMLEAGYKYVVSVPDGAPQPGSKPTQAKFEFLETCESFINLFAEHVIATDNDKPGEFLQQELSRRLGAERCLRVEWPAGTKDANELLVAGGVPEVRKLVDGARFFPVEGLFEVRDIMPDAARMYDEGVARGVSTGWPILDPFLTIRPGELCVVTGIPSSGKSSLIDHMMVMLAQNEGYKCGVFSPENAPLAQHFKKLAECCVGKAFLPGPHVRMTPAEVIEAGRFLNQHFYFINPADDQLNIDEILMKAKVLVYRHGINFLVIDPYNDIDHSRKDSQSETEHASILLSKCQRFARNNRVFVCLVAHPTKLRKDEKTGQYPVPTPYDIAGSAHFRNRADICLSIHRPDLTMDFVEVHVQKVRFKEIGKPGMVRLDYSRESGRFFAHLGGAPSSYATKKARDAERQLVRDEVNAELAAARAAYGEGE